MLQLTDVLMNMEVQLVVDSAVGHVIVDLPAVAANVLECLVVCGTALKVAVVMMKLSQVDPLVFAALLLPLVELHQMNTTKSDT